MRMDDFLSEAKWAILSAHGRIDTSIREYRLYGIRDDRASAEKTANLMGGKVVPLSEYKATMRAAFDEKLARSKRR